MVVCLVTGFACGSIFKGMTFASQDWIVLKWSKDSLGYRPLPTPSKVYKDEKITLSLMVDTSSFPEEGIILD